MSDDGLDGFWQSACALLAEGAADPGSAWRNLALATTAADGGPAIRTVVLRGFDAAARRLDIHTDWRSPKIGELQARPRASLHGWDARRRIQLRLRGLVALHWRDEVAAGAWAALREGSRATYRVEAAPGTPQAAPGQVRSGLSDDAAFAVFCVVRLAFDRLDMMELGGDPHRRARFGWADGKREAMWLVP